MTTRLTNHNHLQAIRNLRNILRKYADVEIVNKPEYIPAEAIIEITEEDLESLPTQYIWRTLQDDKVPTLMQKITEKFSSMTKPLMAVFTQVKISAAAAGPSR
jgi:hypothetical protein